MKGEEFLRRFVQHILPKGFVRIRRFGIYHHSVKRSLDIEFNLELRGFDILMQQDEEKENRRINEREKGTCLVCKTGKMIIMGV